MANRSSTELGKMIGSVHFWMIFMLSAAISVVYYQWRDWFPWFWRYFLFEYRNDILGIPFILPFLYASLVFWWRGSLVAWLFTTITTIPLLLYYYMYMNPGHILRNVGFSLLPLALVMLIAIEIRWRERQKAILAEHEQERQAYIFQILKAHEDERGRVSRELHDGAIQELLLIANHIQFLLDDRGSVDREQLMSEVFNVSEGLRKLSLDLRPSVLDNTGLVPALRSLADRIFQESGIVAKVVVEGGARRFHSDTEIQIFRIVQEALSNVRRHSHATAVSVALCFNRHILGITVRDNGIGFHVEDVLKNLANNRKLGIMGMQQRATLIGGTFDIHSQPGEGTMVSIEVVEHPKKSMPGKV